MSIVYCDQAKTLTLHTANTTYQMQISDLGRLLHLYFGRRVEGACMAGLYPLVNHGFPWITMNTAMSAVFRRICGCG